MKTQKLRGALALGSLTAAVALLAGLSTASAASAPGAGSFPQSFLIPGTNTSLSVYGSVQMRIMTELGSQHVNDTGPANQAGYTPGIISQLALEGPGAGGGDSVNNQIRAIHGGLRWSGKYSNIFFETRTPSDLGEIKTVVMLNFAFLNNEGTYTSSGGAPNSTGSNIVSLPNTGLGNNEVARLQWAYGTLGPWLIGQTNSAWSDPIMFNGVSDQSQVGPLLTAQIRRPQIRYTYLAGNGVTISASLEADTYNNIYGSGHAGGPYTADNTDIGGIKNYPSFNTGIAWTQPWGHLMGRVGFAEDEIRSANFGTHGPLVPGTSGNNLKKFGWAVEGGAMLNTWGHDQWRGLVVYDSGANTYLSDMGPEAFVNTAAGTMDLIKEVALNTSYYHVFPPN